MNNVSDVCGIYVSRTQVGNAVQCMKLKMLCVCCVCVCVCVCVYGVCCVRECITVCTYVCMYMRTCVWGGGAGLQSLKQQNTGTGIMPKENLLDQRLTGAPTAEDL